MIKNYIKIAWKVLKRNKLFTFISLFGISFTLTILLVGTSIFDYLTKSNYPAEKQSRIAYLNWIEIWGEGDDKSGYNYFASGGTGFYLLNNFVCTLKTPSKVSIYSRMYKKVNGSIKTKLVKLNIKYTDNEFWDILNFKFIDGRSYNNKEVEEAQQLSIISESLANEYFGDPKTAIGKIIEADKVNYQIIGVVKDVPLSSLNSYGNIWVPITTSKTNLKERKLDGDLGAMMLVNKKSELKKLESEFQQSLKKIDFPIGNFKHIEAHTGSVLDQFIIEAPISGSLIYAFIIIIILAIIIIPSLNLININTTRISERLSEIGVRKSFGGTKVTLISQFLVENIILTLLGGLIAFIISILILKVVQSTGLIPPNSFPINVRIFFIGLGFCFVFGFISGVLPAYRMSRLQIVESLNEREL